MRIGLLQLTLLSVLSFLCTVALLALEAGAVETRAFRLDDAGALETEELEGTAVLSNGTVVPGPQLNRIALDDAAVAWSVIEAPGGGFLVGTGHGGKVLRLRGESVSSFGETDQLAVTALAPAWNQRVVAATLPEGKLFEFDRAGARSELPQLPGVTQIWDLLWDPRRQVLFAATGPEGKLIGLRSGGQPITYWDSDATHIMALALGDDGAVYAGTDGDAVVARVTDPGQVEVVYDFPGNEITALDARGGHLAVVANEFGSPPRIVPNKGKAPTAGPRPGKGRAWRVSPEGRPERVFAREDRHFTCVRLLDTQAMLLGSGAEGTVFRVEPGGSSALWADVEERQVLDIRLHQRGVLLVTGDGAAAYQTVRTADAQRKWTSSVQDAQFLARFGRLSWRATGPLRFQSRSGNRKEPDDSWSEWSSPMSEAGPIRSPRARFLQLRALFPDTPGAVLYSVTAHYLPQNQRGRVRGIQAAPVQRETKQGSGPTTSGPVPSTRYKLTWQVENPDSDVLRFTIRYRQESQSSWRDLVEPDDELRRPEYLWETRGIPDGWYIVQVRASDSPANPEALALDHSTESEAILVDNHGPRFEPFRVQGSTLRGRVFDAIGPIQRLEVAYDGGTFQALHPQDGLLDSNEESFEATLPTSRPLIVAIRATDARGNQGSRELFLE